MTKRYDFLIVGAGLFGCVCAKELVGKKFKVLIIDKRNHIGGNCAVRVKDGATEHMYGPHIFHTNDKTIWDYINALQPLTPYKHKVVAVSDGLQYDFPINRNTLGKVFKNAGYVLPVSEDIPQNFEQAAIGRIGEKLYNLFYRDYTVKQWGQNPINLSAEIFSRVPIRFDCEDSYFNDFYTGVFKSNSMFEKMLLGADVKLNCVFNRKKHLPLADKIIYTGMIDEFYDYRFGELPYRSLKFEKQKVEPYCNQGAAVINYTDSRPYTRSTEYGYMYNSKQVGGDRWYEYPMPNRDEKGRRTEPYYPMPTADAQNLYTKYALYSQSNSGKEKIFFGGRLGSYRYLNMDQVIDRALELAEKF